MRETLKTIELFKDLTDEQLDAVASRLQHVSYAKDKIIFRQGEIGNTMYLVETGQVVVWDDIANQALAYLGPGSFVGEGALLLAQPRSASLRVAIDADLYVLHKNDFDELLKTNPAIAVHMTRELSQRLRDTSQQRFKVQPRRISVLWGKGGNLLARALSKLLKSKVGLLALPGSFQDLDATISDGVMPMGSSDINESNLAEQLGIAVEIFSHVLLLLPREPNALSHKAINLSNTVISVGEPPEWLKAQVPNEKLWLTDEDMAGLDRIARRLAGRTVGLALSSGGARGVSHIGVMKVLRQEGIPIDLMAGSSAGAIFGSFFAAGWSDEQLDQVPQEIRKFFRRWHNYDLNLPPRSGIARGARGRHLIDRMLEGRRFEDLEIPFYCVAADIMTGEEVVFETGPLADAIRASVSIPILGDPWHVDGRYLIDGAIVDPIPAKLLREKGADIVIASSVILPLRERQPVNSGKMPHFMTIISNLLGAMEAELIKSQEEFFDVLIHSKVDASHVLDFDHIHELVEAGERAARAALPTIRALLAGEGNGNNRS